MVKKPKHRRVRRKKHLIFRRVRFVIILLLVLGGGLYFKSTIAGDRPITGASSTYQGNGSENSMTGNKPDKTDKELDKLDMMLLKKDLENYLNGLQGQYGVYYYNLENNDEFGINQDEEFTAASTVKVPLNLYLYKQIKVGIVNPQEKLTYLQEDYEEGTGDLQYEDFGNQYSIRELSKLSIVSSDNVAANMLFRYLGMANIKDYMCQMGGTVVDGDKNVSCPKDLALYMRNVYELYKNDDVLGKEFMDNLLNTEFEDRIPAKLPEDVKVAHKIGTQVNVINDVGIIFTDSPYILSVMSKGVDENEAPTVIATISKMVYDYVNQ